MRRGFFIFIRDGVNFKSIKLFNYSNINYIRVIIVIIVFFEVDYGYGFYKGFYFFFYLIGNDYVFNRC